MMITQTKRLITLVAFICITGMGFSQTMVSGVKFPDILKAGSVSLHLNGAGVREKYWMDMYVAGLYLRNKQQNATAIINADEQMGIRLQIVSSLISSEKMTEAVNEGFLNSAGNSLTTLQSRISQFKAVFQEEIKKQDIYEMIYDPGKGVLVSKNGKILTTIPGLDFKKALFGIWLCDKPADADLKAELLGK